MGVRVVSRKARSYRRDGRKKSNKGQIPKGKLMEGSERNIRKEVIITCLALWRQDSAV